MDSTAMAIRAEVDHGDVGASLMFSGNLDGIVEALMYA